MSLAYPRFKAAACHAASVYLDSAASADKAAALIAEAAGHGASLVAFPESFLPGFPVWAALRAPILGHDLFRRLAGEAVRLDGPEIARVRSAARRHGVHVSIGITEGTDASVGCLWNANLLIGPDGAVLNLHRKLVPTYYEKLVWANGDARGLRVTPTAIGRLGMLICGENTNPLSRYALMAEGEQVHVSTYPPLWPTRPDGAPGAYDLRRAIEIRAGAHSFEAKVFNVVSSGFADAALIDTVCGDDTAARDVIAQAPRSVSMILDPTGTPVAVGPSDGESIVYAEVDVAACVEPKQFHDVVGYYNRFDIFDVRIDRTPREPATFADAPRLDTLPPLPADEAEAPAWPPAGRRRTGS
ncbi:carbon-nitrogen hydrolase family protein [Rhodoplanes sp. TEM]|uniref:Carbon-nitrogen hydrolase family protein n=1 Tax=Rhodoplanes tepidamans TaxID=200616 RepID=A0ABT5JCY6_RHOTP|nr:MULTISPECIES: carbon-nitrogen hydrolase family protein [Rhodoplanes]MDC7787555.1 carbon-nitrogen hydrolase family protein [Rhodoplanes tepidamans]MDC7984952.1 carbon-nitrogen hydrolase family protein [Rhodoplanes sp. TEM]MDQ0357984.1 putative amidohydrolase [Rhodoplanes tepidamans]